ncbi:D-alanyl-D-alanine carboxypeptidase/D-alanyl-D-alanine-endopeptidase [Oxalobacteraceae bacterium]|nr:D-alanyl-D-alanine carboxypeptidase/D-alanyl-D-alanine-endopeptidase [Oxalobacteraceae bacterium]
MFRRLILAALLAASGAAQAQLPEALTRLLRTAGIPDDAVGIVVQRGATTLVSHGAERVMQPASTIKLVTTLVALEQLGPAFRTRTELRTDAELVQGVLQGALYLRGGADPDFNEDVLGHMLQALRNQGIRHIQGDIVLDRQLFQPARTDVDALPFDEFPMAYYNVIPDALLINNNLLKVELRSSASKLDLVMMPELENVGIRAEMRLIDGPCARWEEGWKPAMIARKGEHIDLVLRGTFPRNCIRSNSVNLLDRNEYLGRLLRASWRKLGGTMSGVVREAGPIAGMGAYAGSATVAGTAGTSAPAPAAANAVPVTGRLLAEHVSRSLPEIVRDTNKFSDNVMARTLFLSLGSLEGDTLLGSHPLPPDGSGLSTNARADQAIRAWFQRQHIDTQGLVMENGSGLSRLERIRPAQMAALLQAGLASPWAPEFMASLPIASVDGTMRKRMKDSAAAMRARLKTGSLNGVVAMAGYVMDANNQPCVVVGIINHELVTNGSGRVVLDALVDWVARSGAPSPVP